MNLSIASTVWSEDFENDFDGWTIGGLNHTVWGSVLNCEGNMSVKDGILVSGEEWGPSTIYHLYSWASHPSSVTEGTWRFDFDITNPSAIGGGLNFISKGVGSSGWPWDLEGYQIRLNTYAFQSPFPEHIPGGKGFFLQKATGGVDTQFTIDNCEYNNSGIYNFIITRDSIGFFDVYINETHQMSGLSTDILESNKFEFTWGGSIGVDNITVSDTIDFDKAPPHIDAEIPYNPIEEGQKYELQLNVSDPSGIDQWWLNAGEYDNDLFTIDQSGMIRNSTVLTIKKYHIVFSVNDTQGYTLNQYYNFRVLEAAILPTTTTTITSNETSGIESLFSIVIFSLMIVVPFRKRKK